MNAKNLNVLIDGVIYIPEFERIVSDSDLGKEVVSILRNIYGSLWIEAYYDPTNKTIQEFATPLAKKMSRLNEILAFKT